ncbi:hypothetical protein ICN10_06075 [Polynucleobacter sp. 86C-FISCH]|uniref:helix-turn-helix domain-containing transcriptional regulator n=1 Tax=Polynucleobacter sp. 86C-FISCH TaxID=2689101 RepID=UPI001C0E7520|nr:hypothetical protein [Polynucleobacter sp. 86C-FISCH]MBU3595966.1 hypothetical protein [Polynucleobacter sp. 86C-FISCH]
MKIDQLSSFDILDYLKTEQDIAGYLQAVNENGDSVLIQCALMDIELARAKF